MAGSPWRLGSKAWPQPAVAATDLNALMRDEAEAAAEMGALAVMPAAVGSGRVVVGMYLGGLGRLEESVAIDYGRRCGARQAGEEAI
jgi:hypothetical protein